MTVDFSGRTIASAIVAGLTLAAGSGCQCRPVTELWLDGVDRVSRCECYLDRLYNPGTDLTRLNKPGGNVGPNALICCQDCGECPPTRDVPVPQFRIYQQPTTLAGAKESFDDRDDEKRLGDVELVPPKAEAEVQGPLGNDRTDRLLLPKPNDESTEGGDG